MNRVFYDRLIDFNDREFYATILKEKIGEFLKFEISKESFFKIKFGDYCNKANEYILACV